MAQQNAEAPGVSFARVLSELRKRNFAVLATASEDGRPHAAGVNYGVSRPDHDLTIYVMTRKHLLKARNIARNPRVSLVIPLRRWLLWFLPPATIQLSGRAEILEWSDAEGTEVFRSFWMGRRILRAYNLARRRGETRVCFLKITPDPAVSTYMVGSNILDLGKRMEAGASRIMIPSTMIPFTPRS